MRVKTCEQQRAVSDTDLLIATGKTWTEWFFLLNRWEGERRHIIPTIRYLVEQQHLEVEWAVIIAFNYCWECLQELDA